jgi:hypothetical protein
MEVLYPQGKSPLYPFERRLGGPQSWSGHGGEEKNSRLLPGLEPLIIQPVAQHHTTELSQMNQEISRRNKFYYRYLDIYHACTELGGGVEYELNPKANCPD